MSLFLVLHPTSLLRQTRLNISCLFFPDFPVPCNSSFLLPKSSGARSARSVSKPSKGPFYLPTSPLQQQPPPRGEHSITQLLIWEIFHITKGHSWMNNKSENIRWGWYTLLMSCYCTVILLHETCALPMRVHVLYVRNLWTHVSTRKGHFYRDHQISDHRYECFHLWDGNHLIVLFCQIFFW